MNHNNVIAYFSMEVALNDSVPTYSGGLGVLAGDFLITAADMEIPFVGITLLHRKGYFFQKFDDRGCQIETPEQWVVEDYLQPCSVEVSVAIENRDVKLKVWKYEIKSKKGFVVPVYFLDTGHSGNALEDQEICIQLYKDEPKVRLSQEAILGIGGVRLLEALHYDIKRYHMNEGHSSLLALELLNKEIKGQMDRLETGIESVRSKCVFTTHTPVPAGHDKFSVDLAREILGNTPYLDVKNLLCLDDHLNMTYAALNLSGYINGVAKRHGEIAQLQNAPYDIEAITNGVHAERWVSPSFNKLYDQYIAGWKEDNFSLRSACGIPLDLIRGAHLAEKKRLIDFVNHVENAGLCEDCFTLGFARRATGYKRADLLFHYIDKLVEVAEKEGAVQCIFAGKAHPKDKQGKEIIQKIFSIKEKISDKIKIVYLSNYDTNLAKLLVAGVDLWLNNPKRPMEASGTSGMKAALNGIPSLSVLDGWWIEGCIEGVTGWTIGESGVIADENDDEKDSLSLYEKLEKDILPMFYNDNQRYVKVMRHAIALNGSFFNTQRMMQQYVLDAYY